jgi:hypothetical protein
MAWDSANAPHPCSIRRAYGFQTKRALHIGREEQAGTAQTNTHRALSSEPVLSNPVQPAVSHSTRSHTRPSRRGQFELTQPIDSP